MIGGGNSAAQAAVWLARGGALVTLLHRRADLAETMSSYLIDELERYGVAVRDRSEVSALHGEDGQLEAVTLTDGDAPAVLVPLPLPRRLPLHRLARRRRRPRRRRLHPHRPRRRRRGPARDQRPRRLRRRRRARRLDQALRDRGRRGRDGRPLRPRAHLRHRRHGRLSAGARYLWADATRRALAVGFLRGLAARPATRCTPTRRSSASSRRRSRRPSRSSSTPPCG